MKDLSYSVTLYDYWSATSGLAGGALADSLCIKDQNGLPFIPGKTMKGLMREAVEILSPCHPDLFPEDFVHSVFGELERMKDTPETGTRTAEATSFFGNAVLHRATAAAVLEGKVQNALFEQIAATAIDRNGIAITSSLRRAEFAIPCTLYGTIHGVHPDFVLPLKRCAAFVKRLGYNRSRGYGRCTIQFLTS